MNRPVLTLPKKPQEPPDKLRFVERRKRYILQEKVGETSDTYRWRDVPMVQE